MKYMIYVAIAKFIFPDYDLRLIILIAMLYTLLDAGFSYLEEKMKD